MRRIAPLGSAILAVSFISTAGPAVATKSVVHSAGALTSGAAIVRTVANRNDGLHSFESSISMDIHERSFPFMRVHLNGSTYFQAPDRYAVVFNNLPHYMKGLPKAYASMLNVAHWPSEFAIKRNGTRHCSDHDEIALELTPRSRESDLEHARAYVDPNAWTVNEVDWTFQKMEFDIVQSFQMEGPFRVLSGNQANIRVPYARATATTTFANYRTNVAIDENIFQPS